MGMSRVLPDFIGFRVALSAGFRPHILRPGRVSHCRLGRNNLFIFQPILIGLHQLNHRFRFAKMSTRKCHQFESDRVGCIVGVNANHPCVFAFFTNLQQLCRSNKFCFSFTVAVTLGRYDQIELRKLLCQCFGFLNTGLGKQYSKLHFFTCELLFDSG